MQFNQSNNNDGHVNSVIEADHVFDFEPDPPAWSWLLLMAAVAVLVAAWFS